MLCFRSQFKQTEVLKQAPSWGKITHVPFENQKYTIHTFKLTVLLKGYIFILTIFKLEFLHDVVLFMLREIETKCPATLQSWPPLQLGIAMQLGSCPSLSFKLGRVPSSGCIALFVSRWNGDSQRDLQDHMLKVAKIQSSYIPK